MSPARTLLAGLLAALATMPLRAQDDMVTRIVVVDSGGQRIPYAFVQLNRGATRTADDSGRVTFRYAARDSIRVHVRRMGYKPVEGWIKLSADPTTFVATLNPAPHALAVVRVEERRNTSLALTGFYDRMERVQRGAYSARLITPEELDLRNPAKVTQMLHGENAIRVSTFNSRAIIEGRGSRCGMNVILDGRLMTGMMEELKNVDQNPQLRRDLERVMGDGAAEQLVLQKHAAMLTSVDELINAGSVAAIEIYSSPASVPVEFQRLIGKGTCGVIAIWSGARR